MFGNQSSRSEKVTDFEFIRIHLSGMRSQCEYEINRRGPKTEILHYSILYRGGEEVKELENSVSCDTDVVLNILNEYGFISWDGFKGPHPKWVKDGIMFRLEASVNGGRIIKASGSENFPKHFKDFLQWMNSTLRSNPSE
ncbi:MAG: hypothetical protein K6A35_05375 [bacterium]|nr:hypothetical protein [bacterium]